MALTSNHQRVGRALDFLRDGLRPFIMREMYNTYGDEMETKAAELLGERGTFPDRPLDEWDAALLLKLMWGGWKDVFAKTLGYTERSLISELREVRNKWAHQEIISSDDTDRALDSAERLLAAVSAPEADEVREMKLELRRQVYEKQMHNKRRNGSTTVFDVKSAGLKPWRELITPHYDVRNGKYQQAEFAADLWQVHLGQGADEYRDPEEFFRRTYLTASLKELLASALCRVAGIGGDPVVQLQTNFGGGKTHSMLALYHLFSGKAPIETLHGIEDLLQATGVSSVPPTKVVVLVGNKISPGNPSLKPDGTQIHTLWGELAWQLGGKDAYEQIRADDEKATSPGDRLRELFAEYGPCVILIDEWVAYARQLHEESDLPAGSFETQFSFAQVLTESAKLVKNCMLVISLPASDTATGRVSRSEDVEVGGRRGQEALERLRNVIGRVEAVWRPATAEEGFEIVRRRLFEPMQPTGYRDRDVVARTFSELYRQEQESFPNECRERDYEERIKAAYPIHPEVFDRLYSDWSTLVKFQRTRGVLRLMASVIYSLWEKGDQSPLILPASIPIDDNKVQSELTRYLSDNWSPIIERDVDGPNSLPRKLDDEIPTLGKYRACRRVARTVYLGSAPMTQASNKGLEERRIMLGSVMPGDKPSIFKDALRRLSSSATYLYLDGTRYWYSTQPTVTKIAEDRADEYRHRPEDVLRELRTRLDANLRHSGDFSRIHIMPQTGADVPDERTSRLVVLGPEEAYVKGERSDAERAARLILSERGSTPRLYKNTLVFLVPAAQQWKDLEDAILRYLAWSSIIEDKNGLDLSPHQVRQAESQKISANSTVDARIPEAYQWLLVPTQNSPSDEAEWQALRLTGTDPLAIRACKKLKSEQLLVSVLAGSFLRRELDRIPLWRDDHVRVEDLATYFASYHYLPRLSRPSVLVMAIKDGLNQLQWEHDSFAYADSYDESTNRYVGLRAFGDGMPQLSEDSLTGLLVKPEAAVNQKEKEDGAKKQTPTPGSVGWESPTPPGKEPGVPLPPSSVSANQRVSMPKRFYGRVTLQDANRMGLEAAKIADEVVSHLNGILGSSVMVTIEIDTTVPAGVPEHVVRTVTENCKTLRFSSQGFEEE